MSDFARFLVCFGRCAVGLRIARWSWGWACKKLQVVKNYVQQQQFLQQLQQLKSAFATQHNNPYRLLCVAVVVALMSMLNVKNYERNIR